MRGRQAGWYRGARERVVVPVQAAATAPHEEHHR